MICYALHTAPRPRLILPSVFLNWEIKILISKIQTVYNRDFNLRFYQTFSKKKKKKNIRKVSFSIKSWFIEFFGPTTKLADFSNSMNWTNLIDSPKSVNLSNSVNSSNLAYSPNLAFSPILAISPNSADSLIYANSPNLANSPN